MGEAAIRAWAGRLPAQDSKRYLCVSLKAKEPIVGSGREYKYFAFTIGITAGKPKLGGIAWDGSRLVAAKKLPAYLSKMAAPELWSQELGSIEYRANGETACIFYYYPKNEMDNYDKKYLLASKGFGYYVELITTQWMKKAGAMTVFTPSGDTSEAREGQLAKVGLPVGYGVAIDKWMKKLADGVRFRIGKYAEKLKLVA